MLTLIQNGYVIDPASGREGIYDILIENDTIKKVEKHIDAAEAERDCLPGGLQVIDASGRYVMPGFIDLHVHLREPGYEYKETIKTGAAAAAAGGFTTVCAMPNTKPVIDNTDSISMVLKKAEEAAVHILPIGAITKNQDGKELADIGAMVRAGAVAISEDGKSVMDSALYAEAMKRAKRLGIPVFAHCEDKSLAGNGVINAGKKAEKLMLPGISNAAEDIITARDIILAKETGARLHLCHCSTKGSTRMLALAKREGLPVTGEASPHHFTLSEDDIMNDDADYKMNPPLRSREDVTAIKEAIRDGIIEVIATDHAPHSQEEKAKSMMEAPFGITGLETAFALTITELVACGYLTPAQLVERMSTSPARILGIDKGCIGAGYIADIVIADPDAEYTIDRERFVSKGKNTPFHGRKVRGRILYTFVSGKLVYEYGKSV